MVKKRVAQESISVSIPATGGPRFARLVDRLEYDNVPVVTKLNRLRRNAMDARTTVDLLAASGVRVHCLGVDLNSPAGRMTMQVIAAVAQSEKDLIVEQTYACIRKAKAVGKTFVRTTALWPD